MNNTQQEQLDSDKDFVKNFQKHPLFSHLAGECESDKEREACCLSSLRLQAFVLALLSAKERVTQAEEKERVLEALKKSLGCSSSNNDQECVDCEGFCCNCELCDCCTRFQRGKFDKLINQDNE